MHIGLVGGVDGDILQFAELALGHGHSFEWQAPQASAKHRQKIQDLVKRAEVVILVTNQGTESAVLRAERLVRERRGDLMMVRTLDLRAFRGLLDRLPAPNPPEALRPCGS